MSTHSQRSLLFSIFFVVTWASIKTTSFSLPTTVTSTNNKSIYDVLVEHGLPEGLLPKTIENYTLSEDGKFEVYLEQACNTKFENELHYDKNISGQLKFAQILNLTGVSAQDLFLWFPVKKIKVDVPSSGVIYFDVGVVSKQFPVSYFESPRDCVAVSDNHDLHRPINALSKRFEGAMRHRFGHGGNAGEVM